MNKKKLILCDLDGTLLNDRKEVPSITLQAIHKFEGIFAIATGRSRESAKALFPESFSFDSRAGVFLNGCQIFDNQGNMIVNVTIEHETVHEAFGLTTDPENYVILFECGSVIYSSSQTDFSTEYFEKLRMDHPQVISEISQLPEKINQICFVCKEGFYDSFLPEIVAFAQKHDLQLFTPIPNSVDLVARKAGKEIGLMKLAEYYGLEVNEIAAIGDASNDLEMIKLAGSGVAMGNAQNEVKECADLIVNSNTDPNLPGVADLLNRLMSDV
jgi:5-amino-6-(5-phospho-D-ribitylamino)uracil phosphatase